MTLEEIKAWLLANKDNADVKTYLGELSTPTVEGVEGFLDTDAGKKVLQPRLDQNFTKGLNTWKEKNISTLVEQELAKRNPSKTPAEIALAELQKKFDDSEKATKKEKNMNTAIKQATAKGLPVDILDIFVSHDEESSTANYGRLEDSFTKAVQAAVESKFKQGGRNFNNDGSNNKADAGAYGKKIAANAAGTNTGLEEAQKSYFE
ncbi:DUF4355 domain-containing protein [Paenisporosarcina sp. OV554]|uniref:DUF4355 domain-containing protein n=1 Tax=Paenisporosarcina sp. OV554 TaxID=2135694 RepID=UPI000D366AA3|nr:DUF4355 domain-containing protein [Paenisporosarcina sp. OV554]PUB12617.1 uncharacterized protein DUF4355 [Paenisporosarcina sp. OV554]